jgi:hypothetical protein
MEKQPYEGSAKTHSSSDLTTLQHYQCLGDQAKEPLKSTRLITIAPSDPQVFVESQDFLGVCV